MMKKRCFIIILAAGSLLLSSCGNQESREQNVSDFPTYIEEDLGNNIQVSAKVILPQSTQFYTYLADIAEVDESDLREAFFAGEEDVFFDEETNYLWSEDRIRRATSQDMIFYSQDSSYFQLLATYNTLEYGNFWTEVFHEVSAEGELDFSTREEAEQIVRTAAEKLGMTLDEEPEFCYAMDENVLQQICENRIEQEPEIEDTLQSISEQIAAEGPCYYIVWYGQAPNGEQMVSGNVSSARVVGSSVLMNTFIIAIVNPKGLCSFFSNGFFQFRDEQEWNGSILSPQDAVNKVEALYKNVINTSDISIDKVEFLYTMTLTDFDKGEYSCIPVWYVCGTKLQDGKETILQYRVNAMTGDVL